MSVNDENDDGIKLVNERLRSLDERIDVPEAAKASELVKKLDGGRKKQGRVLNFRIIGTAAAALLTVAVVAAVWKAALPKYSATQNATGYMAEQADSSEISVAAAPEENQQEMMQADSGGSTQLRNADDGYGDIKTKLEAMFEAGTAAEKVDKSVTDEDTLQYKYREISVEDDGDSVSVLIYDKENGGALLKGFWVQGEYSGAQENGPTVTIETNFAVTKSMLEEGQFVPLYSGEDNLPVQISSENITVADGASKAVFTVYVDIDLESGNYSVRAVLG